MGKKPEISQDLRRCRRGGVKHLQKTEQTVLLGRLCSFDVCNRLLKMLNQSGEVRQTVQEEQESKMYCWIGAGQSRQEDRGRIQHHPPLSQPPTLYNELWQMGGKLIQLKIKTKCYRNTFLLALRLVYGGQLECNG